MGVNVNFFPTKKYQLLMKENNCQTDQDQKTQTKQKAALGVAVYTCRPDIHHSNISLPDRGGN